MKKFYIQLDELLTSAKDRLEDMCEEHGEENGNYYNKNMLKNEKDSFCVDGHMVVFINEDVIIAEDEQHYNHAAMDIEDYCELVDFLAELYG